MDKHRVMACWRLAPEAMIQDCANTKVAADAQHL
jgi:hypothetical protein